MTVETGMAWEKTDKGEEEIEAEEEEKTEIGWEGGREENPDSNLASWEGDAERIIISEGDSEVGTTGC